MPSIIGKRRGARTYYYLVESARVDGKPRIVSQQYLGSAEEVMRNSPGRSAGDPVRSQHKEFGDLAAVWSVLERLDVAAVIDRWRPRRSRRGASVGTYIALAARTGWSPPARSGVRRLVGPPPGRGSPRCPVTALDHRRFWDAMDLLGTDDAGQDRGRTGSPHRRPSSAWTCPALALDMTNFATYIDTTNDKAPIAQRGKAKQKRADLRLVGLALVVTRDGGIPLVSHAYPGDRPDVTQFSDVIDELWSATGCWHSRTVESLTVVFDAGQNSAANHAHLEAAGIGLRRLAATQRLPGPARPARRPLPRRGRRTGSPA